MDQRKKNKIRESSLPEGAELYEIPVEGSLGLLALGAVGLIAWRKKRDEAPTQPHVDAKNGSESI